jgi:hypothetical protein
MAIGISRDLFLELYPGMSYKLHQSVPSSEREVMEKFLPSKLWRLNNLYTIIDKDGEKIPFRMNYAQHRVYAASLIHPRLVILKSRQQGISTFWLIYFFDSAVFGDDLSIGLMAQGKAEASTLLKRVKVAWDKLDPGIKQFLQIGLGKNNTEEFSFNNGSSIFVRTSFRSATLQGLHISELGKIANKFPERAKETKTGTLQAIKAGNPVAIESTAEGMNDFQRIWTVAEEMLLGGHEFSGKDFYPVFLSWLDDPDCQSSTKEEITPEHKKHFDKIEIDANCKLTEKQKNYWIMQYRELGDDIHQEYPATPEEAFYSSKDGTYYARQYRNVIIRKKRIVKGVYDENLPVYCAFDLGMNDVFFMVWFQLWRNEIRIIEEYGNSGEGLEHYVTISKEMPWNTDLFILPHDVKVRELSTGKSRLFRLKQLGIRSYRVMPKIAVSDGIEAVRWMMNNLWLSNHLVEIPKMFRNYTKEWDNKTGNWKNRPFHDEYSNPADAVRYMAVWVKSQEKRMTPAKKKIGSVVDGIAI